MPAENGGGASAARLTLCVLELLTTDGIQGQLLHSLHLSPHRTRRGWRCLQCLPDARYPSPRTVAPAQDRITVRDNRRIRACEVATTPSPRARSLLRPGPRPPEPYITLANTRTHLRTPERAACLCEEPELFFPIGNTGRALMQIEEAKDNCCRGGL